MNVCEFTVIVEAGVTLNHLMENESVYKNTVKQTNTMSTDSR